MTTIPSSVRMLLFVVLVSLVGRFQIGNAFVVPIGHHPSTFPGVVRTTPSSPSSLSPSALSVGRLRRFFGGGGRDDTSTVMEKEEVVPSVVASTVTEEVEEGDAATNRVDDKDKDEGTNDVKRLFAQIKDAGVAGSISLFLWEGAFWAVSIPVAIFGYNRLTGHWPDLSDTEDLSQVGAEAFAFANVARLALPVRIGLAISTTPWVQENIVDRFLKKDGEEKNKDNEEA